MQRLAFFAAAGLTALLPVTAIAGDEKIVAAPTALKWTAASPALPKGAQIAPLLADPTKEGISVYRVKFPAGYKIAPHLHPKDENVTVMSGTFNIGFGDKFDRNKATAVKAGGFFHIPKGMHHYAWVSGPTVIESSVVGPIGMVLTYLDPADDPRTAK